MRIFDLFWSAHRRRAPQVGEPGGYAPRHDGFPASTGYDVPWADMEAWENSFALAWDQLCDAAGDVPTPATSGLVIEVTSGPRAVGGFQWSISPDGPVGVHARDSSVEAAEHVLRTLLSHYS